MFISHRHKFINVSVPKTGSTSLHYALMSHLELQFHLKNPAPDLYHLSAEDIIKIIGTDIFSSYFSCGVTRNPYDRMVSLYHDFRDQRRQIKAATFSEFVIEMFRPIWKENIHFLPQEFFLCREEVLLVNRIYRYEDSLEGALFDIGARIGFSMNSIEHSRRSERAAWRSYYKERRVIEIVDEVYAKDFRIFNYKTINHSAGD